MEAHISVRNKSNENTYNNEVLVYDSLNNFGYDIYGIIIDSYNAKRNNYKTKEEGIAQLKRLYNQFIGQKIMILPRSESKTTDDEYADLRGKYFTIVDINFELGNLFSGQKQELENKKYIIKGVDEKNVEWIVPAYKPEEAILIGFYEKLKSMYVDSVFIYNGRATGGRSQFITPKLTHSSIDSHTGEIVSLNIGDKWICSDFQIVDDDVTVQLYAVFNNTKGSEILVRLRNTFKAKGEMDIAFFSCFVKESDFEARRKTLAERFGEDNANLISLQQVAIGMTKEMCHEAWDTPDNINKTVVEGHQTEQWIYPKGSYLFFTDGILTETHKEY